MRNCDNCDHGSYGLDCNTGIETLYCRETEYEYDVEPKNVCKFHQYINGMEDEKNFILYDESYFGKGFFIIHTKDKKINKFLKLYISNNEGFPHYGLRAFSISAKDNPDAAFNNIDFIFRSNEDFDNGLYEAFCIFAKNLNKQIYTTDMVQQGRNNISATKDISVVTVIISKDIYRGKQHSSNFIDINLGDNYSCENYEAINTLYNTLASICQQTAKEQDIKQILELKLC